MVNKDIETKYKLKEEGLRLEKEDINEAISFYNKLISNKYYVNDYYTYRRLVMLYHKNKDFPNEFNIIKDFFLKNIYSNYYQFYWFRHKLLFLIKNGYANESHISEFTKIFEEYSLKNKDKSNFPTVIADRIRLNDEGIYIVSEEEYDIIQYKYEMEEVARELKRRKDYDSAIMIYNKMIYECNYKSYTYYRELCLLYRKNNDLDAELKIINEYFNSDVNKTEYSENYFYKRLNNVKELISKRKSSNLNKSNHGVYYWNQYIPKNKYDNFEKEDNRIEISKKIWKYKDGSNDEVKLFTKEFENAISQIIKNNLGSHITAIGLVPIPSSKTDKISSTNLTIDIIMSEYRQRRLPSKLRSIRIFPYKNLLKREVSVESSHLSNVRVSYEEHWDSIKCDNEKVKKASNMAFILLDDITTTGTIMDVCGDKLIEADDGYSGNEFYKLAIAQTIWCVE